MSRRKLNVRVGPGLVRKPGLWSFGQAACDESVEMRDSRYVEIQKDAKGERMRRKRRNERMVDRCEGLNASW